MVMPKSQKYRFFMRNRAYRFLYLLFIIVFALYPILDAYSDSLNPSLPVANDIDDDHSDDDHGCNHGSFHALQHMVQGYHHFNSVFWSHPANTLIPLYCADCDTDEWRAKYSVARCTFTGRASPQHFGIADISAHGPPLSNQHSALSPTQLIKSLQSCRLLSSDNSPPVM